MWMTTSDQMLILRQDLKLEVKKQLKCMYLECFDGMGEFKYFGNHFELDPKFEPRVQTPDKVALFIEFRLEKELEQIKNKV